MSKVNIIVPGADFSGVGLGMLRSPYNPFTDAGISILGAWDADDASTYTVDGSNNVLTMPSKVGGFTLSPEAGTSVKAVLQPAGWGGGINPTGSSATAAFQFTGGALLASSVYRGAGPTSATGVSVFALAQRGVQSAHGVGASPRPLVMLPSYPNGSNFQMGYIGCFDASQDGAQNIAVAAQHTGSLSQGSQASPWATGSKAILCGQFGAAGPSIKLNGASAAANAAYFGTNVTSWLLGGADNTYDSAFTGLVKLVIVVAGGSLTAPQIQKLEGYLAWRGGIQGQLPAGHPYYADGPY